jgi:chromosome segregation ATPase
MPKIMNAEGTIVDLAGANALLEKLATLTTEQETFKSLLAEAEASVNALRTENEELKSAAVEAESKLDGLRTELEQAYRDKDTATQKVTELETELSDVRTALEAANEAGKAISAEAEELKDRLSKAVAQAKLEAAEAEAKLENIQNSLPVKGEVPDEIVDQDANAETRAAEAANDKIRAEYARLARSLRPDDRRKARKLLAEHSDVIKGHLARLANEDEPETTPKAADGISAAEWADFNEWLAEREYLRSKKASSLSTGERNTMAAKNRIRYAKNKDLYDRCFKARE